MAGQIECGRTMEELALEPHLCAFNHYAVLEVFENAQPCAVWVSVSGCLVVNEFAQIIEERLRFGALLSTTSPLGYEFVWRHSSPLYA